MKYFPFLFLAFSALAVRAQINLVPNPSFEDTVYCSDQGRMSGCKYWVNCGATPDYMHACHQGGYGVPNNYAGYQSAATGNAYCDVWTYSVGGIPYREFIGVALTQPMIIGHAYDVSFKCSPGTINGYCLQTNKLGIRFSTVPFDSTNAAPIDNFSHVYTNNIVSDTGSWTTVGASFVADSAYTFLVLGNFFDDASTDTASVIAFADCAPYFAVYYIDDVYVLDSPTNITYYHQDVLNIQIVSDGRLFSVRSPYTIQKLTVLNSIGQICHLSNDAKFNATNFTPGLYIVQIETLHQISQSKCLIH
jgi:hypothetical protein